MTPLPAGLAAALADRYRLERELGEGGMAKVYLAHDLKHDRWVAVKVLRPVFVATNPERFLREIRLTARLAHPNILPLLDSGAVPIGGEAARPRDDVPVDAGSDPIPGASPTRRRGDSPARDIPASGAPGTEFLYYVMPYVDGESLRARLDREPRLPLEQALRIAGETADALSYAHAQGVVHRDIKPENILFEAGHAVVADFGIALALSTVETGRMTEVGIPIGTPEYMSPEQASGQATIDGRTDIYALGCMLYEMLTGEPPFRGVTPQAILAQVISGRPRRFATGRSDVPRSVESAILRALEKDPGDRFTTVAEFWTALAATTAVRPPRRRWLAVGLGAGAMIGVVLGYREWSRRVDTPPLARHPLRVLVRRFDDQTGHLGQGAVRLTEALTRGLDAVPALVVVARVLVDESGTASLDSLRARFHPDRFVIGRLDSTGGASRAVLQILDPAIDRVVAETTLALSRGADPTILAESLSLFVRQAFWADLARAERRAQVRDVLAWRLLEQARERSEDGKMAITLRLDREGLRSFDLADSLLREARHRAPSNDAIRVAMAENAERRAFSVEWLRQILPAAPLGLPDPITLRRQALAELDRLAAERRPTAELLELRGKVKEGLSRDLGADSLVDAAILDYRAATDVDRHRASAWAALASAYGSAGLFADALLAVSHAIDEDVFGIASADLLRSQFDAALSAAKYDLAEQACRTGRAAAPEEVRFVDCDVQLWSRTRGDRHWAQLARARVDSLASGDAGSLFSAMRELWVAEILARAGMGDSADGIARRATADAPVAWQELLRLELAYLRVLRGDPDSALTLLRAATQSDPSIRRVITNLPWVRPLQRDPRFPRLQSTQAGLRP
mgnify:CR=1 FL=1